MNNEQKIIELLESIKDFNKRLLCTGHEISIKLCEQKINIDKEFIPVLNNVKALIKLGCNVIFQKYIEECFEGILINIRIDGENVYVNIFSSDTNYNDEEIDSAMVAIIKIQEKINFAIKTLNKRVEFLKEQFKEPLAEIY